MTRAQLLILIAKCVVMLDTLGGQPESHLYVTVCECDMAKWEPTRNLLLNAGLVEFKGHFATITPKGQDLAQKVCA